MEHIQSISVIPVYYFVLTCGSHLELLGCLCCCIDIVLSLQKVIGHKSQTFKLGPFVYYLSMVKYPVIVN